MKITQKVKLVTFITQLETYLEFISRNVENYTKQQMKTQNSVF